MSFSYELAADVRADLRAMDPQLQEAFLDHVESVIEQPQPYVTVGTDTQHWFSARSGAMEFVVRYRLLWDTTSGIVSVVGLEHEPLTGPEE